MYSTIVYPISGRLAVHGHVHVRYMSSAIRLSVCLSVCLSVSWSTLRRLKFSAIFLHYLVRWPSIDIQVKFYGDRPREINTTVVAEYSDFGPIERYSK